MDRVAPLFESGGRLERLHPLWEAIDTLAFTPGLVTRTGSHVRDGLDYKRMMTLVVIALLPCFAMAMFNTGYQASLAIEAGAGIRAQNALFQTLGGSYDPRNLLGCTLLGALYFLPVYAVTMIAGLTIEVVFAVVRREEVSEGFFVSGALIPLMLPPTIPLWQIALATVVGLVFAKEVFGGTGMNFLNPALVVRAILFFGYPADISGDAPWIAANFLEVDGFSGATLLARAAAEPGALEGASWWSAFFGFVPGSMGETSVLACGLGAALLILTGVASWRCMAGVVVGTIAMSVLLNTAGSEANPMFAVPFWWHMVAGGWALGTVFMATDPVSSSYTEGGPHRPLRDPAERGAEARTQWSIVRDTR
jgi:Na+-transporting NADH:ubiquinone oxidoreductase subunit B